MAPVPSKDMQIPPLIGDENFLKDAHSADSNENSIFRFLFTELLSKCVTTKKNRFPFKNGKIYMKDSSLAYATSPS